LPSGYHTKITDLIVGKEQKMDQRHSGYVIGHEPGKSGDVWKVRVTDKDSEYYNKKFVVASTNVKLSTGLHVDFRIGEVGRKSSLCAVDVDLTTSQQGGTQDGKRF